MAKTTTSPKDYGKWDNTGIKVIKKPKTKKVKRTK